MSDNVEDAVPQILQRIRQELAEFRNSVESRLDRLADLNRKQRRDTAGLLVMAKSLSGNFAEELAAIEERVAALEAHDAAR